MKPGVHQYEDKLLEFAYGELPAPEAAAVESHLHGCARCAQALADIRSVRVTMQQLPSEEAPDAGLDSLLAYAEQAAQRNAAATSAPSSFWRRFMMPLASVLAMTVVGVVAWRASRDFDPDPGLLALSMKAEAPQVASPGAAQPPKPEERKGMAAEAASVARGGEGQMGQRSQGEAPARDTETRKPAARPVLAEKKKIAPAYDDANRAEGYALEKEARVAEATPSPEPSAERGTASWGLAGGPVGAAVEAQTGSFGGVGSGGGGRGATARAELPPEVPPAPASVAAAAPPPERASAAQKPAPSAPAKSSYALKGLGTSAAPAAAEAALAEADEAPVKKDSATRARREEAPSPIEAARLADKRGDRQAEVRAWLEVLQGGAQGAERVEALKGLCDAYEALGLFAQADPYCDQLLREFPTSTAARAVAERRDQVQTAPPRTKARPATTAPADATP